MYLGTFSRLARSLATVYIFARVRIFDTSVPFSDLPSVPFPSNRQRTAPVSLRAQTRCAGSLASSWLAGECVGGQAALV